MASSLFILSTVTNDLAANSLFENVFVEYLVSFAATYWLHSTLFLAATYLLIRSAKPNSHFIRERIWKVFATAGFVTAGVQLATGLGFSLSSKPEPPVMPRSVSEEPVSNTLESRLTAEQANKQLGNSLKLVRNSLRYLSEELPETLAESKLSKTKPTSSSTFTELTTIQPSNTAATPIAAAVNPHVSLDATERTTLAVLSDESTAGAAVRAASGTDGRLRTLLSWMIISWFSSSLLYVAWLSLRFRWQMRHVTSAAPSHCQLLESICRNRGVRRQIRLLKSDYFEEPVAYGLLRPTILIPIHVEKRLNRDELAALLSHELAHITRGDIVWLVIGRVLTTCFAFQLLNVLARRSWQEHAEFQCDEWAVDRNIDRLTLARSLTLIAEWRVDCQSCPAVVSASGSLFHISDRVERLVADAAPDSWQRGSRRLAIHAAALTSTAMVVVFGPQTGTAAHESENEKPATANVETEATVETQPPFEPDTENAITKENISALVDEIDGLSDDVFELLSELRAMEPVLSKMEKQPEFADQVSQIRRRIGQLRTTAEMQSPKTVDTSRNTGP